MATLYYVNALLPGDLLRWNYGSPAGTPVSLSYGYLTQLPSYATDPSSPVFGYEAPEFEPFTAAQKDGVVRALAQFADVANVTFTALGDGDSAQLRYGNAILPQGDLAHAYLPVNEAGVDSYLAQFGLSSAWRSTALDFAGDVWMSAAAPQRLDQTPGAQGFWATLHETGHALGLDHPFYEDPGDQPLPAAEDNLRYTVMSYNPAPGLGVAPSTLMLYDIAALQYLYGANLSTRAGDTAYSWADGAGFLETIWDGGGNDTIDASNWTSAVTIDLRGGMNFSSIGAAQNLTIAFGATIENATGGSGDDTLWGNDAANRLDGGAGDDLFYGSVGADRFIGGSGNDTVSFTLTGVAGAGLGSVTIDLSTGTGAGAAAGASFTGIENVTGTYSDDILTGDAGANRLKGGPGGFDIFEGGAGADTIEAAASYYGTARYTHSAAGVQIDLQKHTASGGDAQGDVLVNIRNLEGSAFADTLIGDTQRNFLRGAAGNDWLDGSGGADFLYGGEGDDIYIVRSGDLVSESGASGFDEVRSLANTFSIFINDGSVIERLVFIGTGDFVGEGDNSANEIIGGDGNDILTGRGGADRLDGGAGFDLASYDSPVTVDLSGGGASTADAAGDVFVSIEGVRGSVGNDHFIGGAGDDYFDGRSGNDDVDGGDGYDVAVFSGTARDYDVSVSGGVTTVTPLRTSLLSRDGTDTLRNVEEVRFTNVAPANHAPRAVLNSTRPSLNVATPLNRLITTLDGEGDAVQRLEFRDPATGGGMLSRNGAVAAVDEVLSATYADLSQLSFTLTEGSGTFDVRAFDGVDWGAWTTVTVLRSNVAPTLDVPLSLSARRNSLIAASSFFTTATDTDGDPIIAYQFEDSDGVAGYFEINGVAQAQGAISQVSAADLGTLSFRVGSPVGELVVVRAFDGIDWSAWRTISVNTAPNAKPVVTVSDITAPQSPIAATALFGVTDADGDAMTQYEFWDAGLAATSGHFEANGVAQAGGQSIGIAAADLGGLTFRPGTTSDVLWVRASDGADWSDWKSFTVSPLDSRPPVTIHSGADIHSAADGVTLFTEVASDGALKEPMASAHAKWSFSADGATASGTAGRDLVYFTADNRELLHALGGDGDDIYVVQYVPGQLQGGDPRIGETSWGGEDTVWVNQNDYILPNYVENLVSMTERGVRMLANDFANKFIGGPGDDQLFSGTNDDIVYGREGNDLIVGGSGNDTLFGCAGADTFAWELDHIGENDRIMDWEAGQDRLDLRGVLLPGGRMNYVDGTDGLQVWADRDGTGADKRIVVTLAGIHAIDDVRPYVLT